MTQRPEIGFDRTVRLPWAEEALTALGEGMTRAEARNHLKAIIAAEVQGKEAAEKCLTTVSRLWLTPPDDLLPLRDRAVELRQRSAPDQAALLWHWGMAVAVFPFFHRVAAAAGRLARLQGVCSARQLQRRMLEQLGDRQIVSRATRHVLRTMVAWEALEDTDEKGVYRSPRPRPIGDGQAASWLVEAALRSEQSSRARLSALVRSPSLFPFDLNGMSPQVLASSGHLDIVREGLQDEVLVLRS